MEALAIVIVLLSWVVFIFGVINIILPLKALRIRKRLIGVFIVLGSVAGCMGGGVMGAMSQPGGLAAGIERAEADRLVSEKRSADTAAKRDADRAAAEAEANRGMTQQEFNIVWNEANSYMGPCDARVETAQEAMRSGSVYDAYPRVQRAEQVCGQASLDMLGLDFPRSAKGEVRDKLREAKDRCTTSMTAKQSAMGAVAKVVNGDSRPSAVNTASERMDRASTMTMVCAVAFLGAANAAGLTIPGAAAE